METYVENRKAVRSAIFSIMIGILLTIAIQVSVAKPQATSEPAQVSMAR